MPKPLPREQRVGKLLVKWEPQMPSFITIVKPGGSIAQLVPTAVEELNQNPDESLEAFHARAVERAEILQQENPPYVQPFQL